jgi:putative membrane protein
MGTMRQSFAYILITALAILPGCKKKAAEAPPATTEGSAMGSSMAMNTPPADPTTGSAMGSATAPAGSAAEPAATGSAAPAATLTDPQIAAIVVAANQVDIDAGNLAIKKTKNAEVKKFAQLMVTDHTAINKAAVALVTKLKVTPEESDASKGLVSGGADNRAKLEKLDGAAFDKAYVDNEVAYHKAVIDTIDSKLIPSAQNADLKNTLISVKPTIEAHLKHAEMVQQKL